MAGAGYKLFNTGDVLTAAQVNTYLQEQVVMRFANATARTTALSGVLAEGMVSYLDDTNTLEVYNGSAWVGATGDITEVQAGTGISVASGSGPIPVITNTVATAYDAKADLIVGTGADTFSRLAVGANDLLVTADSSTATGLAYTGGWTTWTPTLNGVTVGNGTLTARYCKIGKTVHYFLRMKFGTTSAITGSVSFNLPITPSPTGQNFVWGGIFDYGVATYGAYGEVDGGDVYCRVAYAGATYLTGSLFSSTVPMTWGNTDVFFFSGTYEVA